MEKEIQKLRDIELLSKAFEEFNKATDKLQSSYNLLQDEANKLRLEVEEKNRKLNDMSQLLQSLLMNSSSGIIATDINHKKILQNRAFEELTAPDTPFFCQHIFLYKDQGVYETVVNDKYLKISVGIFTEGPKSGYVYVIDDVTAFKKIEKENQRNEKLKVMGEMAANIAHEIRNPLGSIELFASLLKRDLSGDTDKQRIIDSIIKGVKTINSTISNILLFTKDIRININRYYIADIVDDVILFLKHLMIDKKIIFKNLVDENHTIDCDIELMKQVVMNLIHNAIDAVSESGKIVISSRELSGECAIMIEDNGSGIDKQFMAQLFIPFQTTKAKGTGLGLSICYKIIKAHKGNIIPESEKGKYTRFTIIIPKKR